MRKSLFSRNNKKQHDSKIYPSNVPSNILNDLNNFLKSIKERYIKLDKCEKEYIAKESR